MIIKIFILLFVLFVLSRLILRLKDSSITIKEFIFWTLLWIGIIIVTFLPWTTNFIANLIGIGRGVDAIIYLSIVLIFYAIFHIGVKLEHIEYEITKIVRKEALKEKKKQ